MIGVLLGALTVLAIALMLLGPAVVLMVASTFNKLIFALAADDDEDAMGFAVLVRNGAIAEGSSPRMVRMGGPGVLDVDENSAAVLEKFGRATRVLGPGYHLLDRYERVRGAVDLRPQLRKTNSKIYTRDGIPIQYDVEIEFRLLGETSEEIQHTPKQQSFFRTWMEPRLMRREFEKLSNYRFSPHAARSAVFPLDVTDTGQMTNWSDAIMRAGMGEIDKALSTHSFDELSLPSTDGALASHMDMSVRRRVQREAESAATAALQKSGAQLISLRFSSFRFDDEEARGILDQYFKNWQAHWQNAARLTREDGRTEAFKVQEDARAEAQLKMLALLADGLNQINTRKANYDFVMMLRLFESLEHMALDTRSYRFIPDEVFGMMQKLSKLEPDIGGTNTPPSLPAPQA